MTTTRLRPVFHPESISMLHKLTRQERLAVRVIATLLVLGVLGLWLLN